MLFLFTIHDAKIAWWANTCTVWGVVWRWEVASKAFFLYHQGLDHDERLQYEVWRSLMKSETRTRDLHTSYYGLSIGTIGDCFNTIMTILLLHLYEWFVLTYSAYFLSYRVSIREDSIFPSLSWHEPVQIILCCLLGLHCTTCEYPSHSRL